FIPSASATEEPPNFCTIKAMGELWQGSGPWAKNISYYETHSVLQCEKTTELFAVLQMHAPA
ncbi:MAG: hypothetical protein RLZZ07_906, partial [Actinomycetota bacterium]